VSSGNPPALSPHVRNTGAAHSTGWQRSSSSCASEMHSYRCQRMRYQPCRSAIALLCASCVRASRLDQPHLAAHGKAQRRIDEGRSGKLDLRVRPLHARLDEPAYPAPRTRKHPTPPPPRPGPTVRINGAQQPAMDGQALSGPRAAGQAISDRAMRGLARTSLPAAAPPSDPRAPAAWAR
jgi:hypothetical protein